MISCKKGRSANPVARLNIYYFNKNPGLNRFSGNKFQFIHLQFLVFTIGRYFASSKQFNPIKIIL